MTAPLLLNPASPEIATFAKYPEWHTMSDEQQAKALKLFQEYRHLHPSLLEQVSRFIEGTREAIEAMRPLVEMYEELRLERRRQQ